MRVRSLLKPVTLVMLFGIPLAIYIFLKRKTSVIESVNIYNLLIASGLNKTLAGFAVAQAAHETAGFTSVIFKSNHNAFGMKYAKQINAQGEKNGYANYLDVRNSVADFVAWYTRHRTSIFSLPLYINSLSSYVRFLKNNGYFEAAESDYLKGVTYFYTQIFG